MLLNHWLCAVLDDRSRLTPELTYQHDPFYYLDFAVLENHYPFHIMRLDGEGIPLVDYGPRLGIQRNYLWVAMWGFICLHRYLREKTEVWQRQAQKQAGWLLANLRTRPGCGLVWEMDFASSIYGHVIHPPAVAAMGQALSFSFLIRCHRVWGMDPFAGQVDEMLQVFCVDIRDGGVQAVEDGLVFYEEYAVCPPPHVLDGFLVALLGLYDAFEEFGSARAKLMFDEGIATLKANLPTYDAGGWSYYDRYHKLSTRIYHKWNTCLIETLGKVTGDPQLLKQAEDWNIHRQSLGTLIRHFWKLLYQEKLA